jgi:hypothetical protein
MGFYISRAEPGLRNPLSGSAPYFVGGMESALEGAGKHVRHRSPEMTRRRQRAVMQAASLLISAALLGCANSNDRVDNDDRDDRDDRAASAPDESYERIIERARASIDEAEQSGAREFGGAELALAEDKLRAAETAADDGEMERAEQLAVEADLDADLAVAITRNKQTQELVTEVRAGLRALEDEARRSEPAGSSRP